MRSDRSTHIPRRRPSYRFGVRWIAETDEPECLDVEEVSGYISTLLLADLFGKEPEKVAADVVRLRKREGVA